MKHMLWKGLLALTLAAVMQTAQAVVDVKTIDTPGLTNKESFEPYSNAEITFTDELEYIYSRTYYVDFTTPMNFFGVDWSVDDPNSIEGYDFVDWVYLSYPSMSREFYFDSEGPYYSAIAGGGTDLGNYAIGEDFYNGIRINIMNPRGYFLDSSGNQVVLDVPTRISRFYYGTDTSLMIPEPETYAMLLSGLGVLGWVGRRKKKLVSQLS